MRAKIAYLEGDFPSYIVSSREECRDCVDRFAYDALKGRPDEKCVQVGKVCVERIGKGGRPRQMTAEETAVFIEEYSERLVIEHLGYTPAVWYQGGSGHNDDRLVAVITEDGDVSVSDGVETQIYSGSRTPDEVSLFVRDWLENLWQGRVE